LIYEHAYLTTDPAKREDFERSFGQAKNYLLSANGGRTVDLVRSADRPGLYLLRVGWESVAQHTEVFASSENGKRLAEAIAHFFLEPPQVVHFEGNPA
jgi:heme-degrading monooxygenase HmoA